MKAKIIAVANEKGGIGKTTTVVNTGAALVKKGFKVLTVDFDPQTNLTVSLGFPEPEKLALTITNFISDIAQHRELNEENIKKAILSTNGIDLLPASYMLMDYEYTIKSITDGEYALSDILKPLRPDYDYILIDCMSSTGIFTINALVAADTVLIPSQAHYLSTNGLQLMLYTIKTVMRRLNPHLKIEGILVTMSQSNTNLSKTTIETLKEDYSSFVRIFNTIIPLSIAVAEAPKKGISVLDYMKKNIGSIAYQEFVEEMLSYGC